VIFVAAFVFVGAWVFGRGSLLAQDESEFNVARLRKLLASESASEIHWDSARHFHTFPSPALKVEVHAWANLIDTRPGVFLRILEELSPQELKTLITDDLSRRNDWLDVLSIAIKEEVQARWAPAFERYPFNRSQLWSLAKTRLRNLYSQKEATDDFGFALFRHSGATNLDFVVGCVDSEPTVSGVWDAAEKVGFAGLQFVEFKFAGEEAKLQEQAALTCGSRAVRVQTVNLHDWPTPIPESVPWIPREESSSEIYALASIGLTNHVSKSMLQATQFYLRWFRDYRLVLEEEVMLREALAKGLGKVDLFMPAIIMADANHFRFGLASERGTRLVFEKIKSPKKIRLEILLPPKDDRKGDKSLILDQEDMASFLKARSSLPVVMDLACFSQKYMLDWLAVFSKSRKAHDATQKDFQSPSIITSGRGHRGESSFQIILIMDQVLGALDRMAAGNSWSDIDSYLNGAAGMTRYWNFLTRLWQSQEDWESSSLQPVILGQPPFDQIQDFKKWQAIEIHEQNGKVRLFMPQLLTDRF